ncbi:MAG: hypothetical protein AAF724_05800 [Pseudomonadota bacterium]
MHHILKIATALLVVPLITLTGCVSAPGDPQTSTQTAPAEASERPQRDNSFVEAGAVRNETYPTFERAPKAATAQMSDEEKQALLAEMAALKEAQSSGGNTSAAYAARYRELQDIARSHGVETRNEIEQ